MAARSAIREALEDFSTAIMINKQALNVADSTGLPNSRYMAEIEKLETYQKATGIYSSVKTEERWVTYVISMRDALEYLQGAFRILKGYSALHDEKEDAKERISFFSNSRRN